MWSLGNEICDGHPHIAPTAEFIATAKKLDAIAKSEDRTRPTTNANNAPVNTTNEYGKTLDIYGFNYYGYTFAQFKRKNPDKPFFASESQCMIASRGEFIFPVTWGWTMENSGIPYATSFGTEACGWSGNPGKGWACPPDVQWYWMDANPECMGEFIWTGWDYLGGPYWADSMVKKFGIKGIHSCATGFFDLAGFRKDTFYLYQSRWMPDYPMAHILPHWNWPERVGKVTPVHVFTTGDEGELFLNGRSLGRQKKQSGVWDRAYRLRWDNVVYEPGKLEVVTYKNGKEWARAGVKTTGAPAKLSLEPETKTVAADGEDICYVNVSLRDAEGLVVPRTRNPVTFSVEGPGVIIATDNGDETDFDDFRKPTRRILNGWAQALVRAVPGGSGRITVTVKADGLPEAKTVITAVAR
jgi:beta-galactosidase